MCGIWACFGTSAPEQTKNATTKVLPRGPEAIQTLDISNIHLGFTRLAINGLTDEGMQPMFDGKSTYWICNGEIYNWKDLAARHSIQLSKNTSDTAILGHLWHKLGRNPDIFFKALDGVFALILVDLERNEILVGRDPYGVRPLFQGRDIKTSNLYFASEMKALYDCEDQISSFNPGHYATYTITDEAVLRLSYKVYHTVPWLKNPLWSPDAPDGLKEATVALRYALQAAVKKRLMTERPCAALLSGGIDSSLICSLVQSELKALGKPPLKTFSIGFEGSPDLAYARKVAEHIGSDHTEIISTPDEFFNAIPEVVKATETYDITSIRASVGNWMVCREIAKRTDCKVVFNGDGSDEVFGSYLYFFRAPSDEEFEAESANLLENIHMYDVLRSDRSISSHGLEARTPFLDKQFVAVARAIATIWRRPRRAGMERSSGEIADGQVEKWILRKAFEGTGLLPDEVLWRQKEAFSDGVSSKKKSWYEEIQDRIGSSNSNKTTTYTYLPPPTPEAKYYRDIFTELYGDRCARVLKYFWMPKWSGETTDPSARTLSVYNQQQPKTS
jgi:asparagine synthase (glutamine-hydrolysing)